MKKTLCIYHRTDLDGHCSGALVKMHVPDAELAGYDYADKITAEHLIAQHEIDKETTVYMVDFSLEPFDEMLKLNMRCAELIWCDHHKTALAEYAKYNVNEEAPLFSGRQSNDLAGCELVWKWLRSQSVILDIVMPEFVKYIGRYDVWDHEDVRVVPFQYGMRAYTTNPAHLNWGEVDEDADDDEEDENIWEMLAERVILESEVIDDGNAILRYIEKDNRGLVESSHFVCHVGTLKCIAVNKLGGNSTTFDSIWDAKKYDAMLLFGYTGVRWRFSIFTTKTLLDVGAVAKCFGGGGHAKAAGWTMDQMFPFCTTGEVLLGRKVMRIVIPE